MVEEMMPPMTTVASGRRTLRRLRHRHEPKRSDEGNFPSVPQRPRSN
jgi:hypothetical protein